MFEKPQMMICIADQFYYKVKNYMDCQSCKLPFTSAGQVIRKPLLLVKCGHTMCHDCCFLVINHKKQIKCPVCHEITTVQSVDDLPVNFSLLNLISPGDSITNIAPTWEQDFHVTLELDTSDNKPSTLSIMQSNGSQDRCLLHNQKLQAFCENDKTLLCIDCILKSEHKQHQMLNLDQAFTKYQGLTATAFKHSQAFDFEASFTAIDDRREQLRVASEQTFQKIQKFSDYLIQKINKRKNQLATIIKEKLKGEIEKVKNYQQYFTDMRNQALLAKDLVESFQSPHEKLQFLSQVYLIQDLLQVQGPAELSEKGDQVSKIGSCHLIDSQFKAQEELNYFIQAFKKRLRILQSQSANNTMSFANSPKCTSLSEFKVGTFTAATNVNQLVQGHSSNGSSQQPKIQESIQRAQISKRPQSQNSPGYISEQKGSLIFPQPSSKKDYLTSSTHQYLQAPTTLFKASSKQDSAGSRSKQAPPRSRQAYQNFKYDSEKFKLSTYSIKGNPASKMTMIETTSKNNNTILENQNSFNGVDQLNQIYHKCLTVKKPTPTLNPTALNKQHNSFLDLKRMLSSRTPKMNDTQHILAKVQANISETKKLLEKRHVRSNERPIIKQSDQSQILHSSKLNPVKQQKRSSENVSSDSREEVPKAERKVKHSCHSPEFTHTFSGGDRPSGVNLIGRLDECAPKGARKHGAKFTSEEKVSPQLLYDSNNKSQGKTQPQSQRKKWNIPKTIVKLTDDYDGGETDEFEAIRTSTGTSHLEKLGGYTNSSQISLRQVIYTPSLAKPGIGQTAHTCM